MIETIQTKTIEQKFTLGQLLGTGQFSNVYEVSDNNGKKLALKQYNESGNIKDQENEAAILHRLRNPHIVQLISSEENFTLMPQMQNGELFNYIPKIAQIPTIASDTTANISKESVVRTLFIQLINAMQYMFSQDVIHRDIKLENILLDENYNLVLADFGLASIIKAENDSVSGAIGTENYMAPQVFGSNSYEGKKADIFSCGVVLFTMLAGFPPFFKKADRTDPFYQFFVEQRNEVYWRALKVQFGQVFSSDFMTLIDGLLNFEPKNRPSIQEIQQHPWLSGPIVSQKEIINTFKTI